MLSPSVVNELVHKCDVVYHLAAAVGVRLIVEQPVRTLVTNVQGTEIVLDYCNRFGKRVLIASTSRGLRRPPRGAPARARTPAASTARRPQRRWALRRLEGDGRVPRAGLPPGARPRLRDRAPLQHGRPAPERPVRHGHPELRRARARRPRRSRSTATARRRAASATSRTRSARCRALMDDRATTGRDLQRRLDEPDLDPRPRRARLERTRLGLASSSSSRTTRSTAQGIEDMLHREPSIEKIREASRLAARARPGEDLGRRHRRALGTPRRAGRLRKTSNFRTVHGRRATEMIAAGRWSAPILMTRDTTHNHIQRSRRAGSRHRRADGGCRLAPAAASPARRHDIAADEFDGNHAEHEPVWTFVEPPAATRASPSAAAGRTSRSPPAARTMSGATTTRAPACARRCPTATSRSRPSSTRAPAPAIQMQGIIVEQDSNDLVRAEIHHDGAGTRLFVATIADGNSEVRAYQTVQGGAPQFLRIVRTGNSWRVRYSRDGSTLDDHRSLHLRHDREPHRPDGRQQRQPVARRSPRRSTGSRRSFPTPPRR